MSSSSSAVRSLRATLSRAGPALLLFAMTLLAYAATRHAGFVWNDPDYVTRADLRSWSGLWRIWFEVGSTEQHYPILHGAFWLEHRLWGDAAAGYHLVNVLLHAGSACLFAAILRRLAIPGAWLAAFIFALHPVAVESVAWISEQKNTLSTFFYLAAALVYLRYDEDRRPAVYRVAMILFLLALLSKSLTATLPAALLVIVWWRRGSIGWRRDVVPLLPWFILGAACGLFSAWVEYAVVGAKGGDFDLTFGQRVLVAGRSIWFYLGKLLWPANLDFIYPRWIVSTSAVRQWLFPLAAVVMTVALWLIRGRSRAPLAAWLLFVGSLFPVMGFFSLYGSLYSFVADHWQYQPCLAIIALAAAAITRLRDSLPSAAAGPARAATVVMLGVLGVLTWCQTQMYHDAVTFYRTIVARNPDCWMAWNNLGNLYLEAGLSPEATAAFVTAQHTSPRFAVAPSEFPAETTAHDLLEAGIAAYQAALRSNSKHAVAFNNLATACLRAGRIAESLEYFQRALDLDPDYAEAHANFGLVLTQFGQPAEAIKHLHEAIRLKYFQPEAHQTLGDALAALGRLDEAIHSYEISLELDPTVASAHLSLARVLLQADRIADAIAQCQAVLARNPRDNDARIQLGLTFARAGRNADAIAQFETILRLDPDHTAARLNLGNALSAAGRPADAVPHYAYVLRQHPDLAEAHNNLGFALLRLGHVDEAIVGFKTALKLQPGFTRAQENLALAEQEIAKRAAQPPGQ